MLQSAVLVDNVKVGLGSDINILSFYPDMALDEDNLRNFLENEKRKPNSDILGWTCIYFTVSDKFWFVQKNSFQNKNIERILSNKKKKENKRERDW